MQLVNNINTSEKFNLVADWIRVSASSQNQKLEKQEEERIAALSVSKDPQAFQLIFDRYYEVILNFLYRRTLCRDQAEDLTSQTFLKAFDFLKKAERDVHVRPWLYRIAINVWLSHENKNKRGRSSLGPFFQLFGHGSVTSLNHQIQKSDDETHLRKLLLELDPKFREPLLMRYDEELSHCEIAEVIGITVVNVRARVCRGLKIIRRQWLEYEKEELR